MKKIITILALFILLHAPAFAQKESDFGFLNGAILSYEGNDTDVVIPAQINSIPVTSIGKNAFANNQLTSVTIPDSVTVIEEHAFAFNKLRTVTIPDSVTTIGSGAFYFNELTSINLGNSIRIIKDSAFCENRLTNIIIPESVIEIQQCAFWANPLGSITIGANVELNKSYFEVFVYGFDDFYEINNKRAGTYINRIRGWSIQ